MPLNPLSSNPSAPSNCAVCGTAFLTWPYLLREGYGRFCSKDCRYAARKKAPVEIKAGYARRSREYYQRHGHRAATDYQRQWYIENRTRILDARKARYEPERARLYRTQNADGIREYRRQYQQDGHQSTALAHRRNRLRAASASDISSSWLRELKMVASQCLICTCTMHPDGRRMDGKTLDHIVPIIMGGRHSQANVRYICRQCNLSRPKDGRDIAIG